MSWLSRVINAVSARALPSFWTDKLSWGGLIPPNGRSHSGISVTPETALGLTAYYAGINVIATDVASLPLQVFRRRRSGGHDEVRDDPRWELLSVSPDGETTAMRWRQAWLAHALGHGNGFAEIEADKAGRALALWLLDPAVTRAELRPQDKVLFYRSGADTLPPYKVLHLAGLGRDGLSGYSLANLHREAIGLGLAAEAYGASYFGNGTTPKGALKTPNKLSDTAVKHLRETWNDLHRGPENAHKPAILEQGLEWQPFAVPPEEAQFIATRQFQVLEICRMLRLPPHKLGDYSHSHLTNIEAANIDYLQTTIMPWCRAIEAELNRKLFTADERARGLYIEHDMRGFLRGDAKSRAEFYTRLLGLGSITPNQVCDAEGFNPIGPDGDKRFISVNFVPIDQAGQKADPKAAPDADAGPAADDTTEPADAQPSK